MLGTIHGHRWKMTVSKLGKINLFVHFQNLSILLMIDEAGVPCNLPLDCTSYELLFLCVFMWQKQHNMQCDKIWSFLGPSFWFRSLIDFHACRMFRSIVRRACTRDAGEGLVCVGGLGGVEGRGVTTISNSTNFSWSGDLNEKTSKFRYWRM